jgi:hypothetical protein
VSNCKGAPNSCRRAMRIIFVNIVSSPDDA